MFETNLGVLAVEFPPMSNTYPVIDALKVLNEQKMGAAQSYHLAKVVKKVSDEVQSFVDAKLRLVKENGHEVFEPKEKEEDPDKLLGFQVNPDQQEFVASELMRLADVKIQFEGEKLKLADLSAINLSPKEMGPLMWLIEE